MTVSFPTYKNKPVKQPIVISSNFWYDVTFIDCIGEYHSIVNLTAQGVPAAAKAALYFENLSLEDIQPGSIEVFKKGNYTVLTPRPKSRVQNYETKVKQVAKRFKIMPDNSVVEIRLTMENWAPFSRYARIADTEYGMKKLPLKLPF